jgi:hypothetical protein
MDLTVNIPLEGALDLGWQILADCFEPMETGIQTKLTDAFWPKDQESGDRGQESETEKEATETDEQPKSEELSEEPEEAAAPNA